jgi:hypothetical protein
VGVVDSEELHFPFQGLKTFNQFFEHRIDGFDGSAVIREKEFLEIQADARKELLALLIEADAENKDGYGARLSPNWFYRVLKVVS